MLRYATVTLSAMIAGYPWIVALSPGYDVTVIPGLSKAASAGKN